jgi:uncharacterized protein YjbI with pentapeptide repeats
MRVHWAILLVILQFYASGQIAAFAADFSDANLSGANLTSADLRGSNLAGADLTNANLSGTNLMDTNITQSQLDSACGFGTKLPAGLEIKPCPASTASGFDTTAIGQLRNADANAEFPQPSEHIEVLSNSQIKASYRAARQ